MLIHTILIKAINVGIWILLAYVGWILFIKIKKVFKDIKEGKSGNKSNPQTLDNLLGSLDIVDNSEEELRQHIEESHSSPGIEQLPK